MALTQIVNDGLGASLTATSEGGAVTTSVQQGLSKAWFNFNGTGTVALADSFNMSSVTDNAAGDYTPIISSAMGNTNYAVVVGGQLRQAGSAINMSFQIKGTTIGVPDSKTTTQVRMDGKRGGGTGALDLGTCHGSFMGDLA